MAPAKAPAAGKEVEDTPELRAEIKAFASQLGLSGAAAGSFEYGDFAPAKAGQRPAAAAGAAAAAAGGGKKDGKDGGKERRQDKKDGKEPKQQQDGKPEGKQRHRDREHAAAAASAADAIAERQAAARARAQEEHDAAVTGRTWVESVGPRPGESKGRSLLAHNEPTIWYEAAANLPALKVPAGARPLGEAAVEELRAAADRLLEQEAGAFERDLARRNAADSRWLSQVRRSGTTSDKVAAMTLLVQVRGLRVGWRGGGRLGWLGLVGGGGVGGDVSEPGGG
jgi:ribosome biogenesis protein MAK21